MPEPTHYDILGLARSAEPEAIKAVYKYLSQKYHPDKAGTGSEQVMSRINEAYSVLIDSAKREAYDKTLDKSHAQQEQQIDRVSTAADAVGDLVGEIAKRATKAAIVELAATANAAVSLAGSARSAVRLLSVLSETVNKKK